MPASSTAETSVATAMANTGIMFTNLFHIRLICHKLGYIKFLGYVPLMFNLAILTPLFEREREREREREIIP